MIFVEPIKSPETFSAFLKDIQRNYFFDFGHLDYVEAGLLRETATIIQKKILRRPERRPTPNDWYNVAYLVYMYAHSHRSAEDEAIVMDLLVWVNAPNVGINKDHLAVIGALETLKNRAEPDEAPSSTLPDPSTQGSGVETTQAQVFSDRVRPEGESAEDWPLVGWLSIENSLKDHGLEIECPFEEVLCDTFGSIPRLIKHMKECHGKPGSFEPTTMNLKNRSLFLNGGGEPETVANIVTPRPVVRANAKESHASSISQQV